MVKDVSTLKQPGCWLRSSHSFKECVIAHWSSIGAPKIIGAKTCHRSLGICDCISVEEQCVLGRSQTGRVGGLYTRENAGISSESKVRNFAVESLRFPGEGSSSQGKSGPKPRPKGVGDGQQVDIPVPPTVV